jgi:hypothetical protein
MRVAGAIKVAAIILPDLLMVVGATLAAMGATMSTGWDHPTEAVIITIPEQPIGTGGIGERGPSLISTETRSDFAAPLFIPVRDAARHSFTASSQRVRFGRAL